MKTSNSFAMDEFMNKEISDEDLITQWLNSAALSQNTTEKVDVVHKLQEFLVHKAPHLLLDYLDNVLSFASVKSTEIKKALVGFIEEACKMRDVALTKVMVSLHMLLCDDSIPIQKRVIQAAISIYKKMLSWICSAPTITEEMEKAWNQLNLIKNEIVKMIDSDNDGIRTSAVKFLEGVVLLQTYPNSDSKNNGFSLEDVPLTLIIARRRKLEEEANNIFDLLINFTGSQHISSANLFACIGALTSIAKHRWEFMERVVHAIELLHSNLPPTLSSMQVNSIRKKLKSELTTLVKHPAANDFVENISTMLIDLGYSQQEIQKILPKSEDRKRRREDQAQAGFKRARLDKESEADQELMNLQQKMATEANEKFVSDALGADKAVNLVLLTLPKVPQVMPNQFKIDYNAFLKLGRVGDFKVLAKMLAIQLLEVGLGPGAEILKAPLEKIAKEVEVQASNKRKEREDDEDDREKKKERLKVPRIKTLKLTEITNPLDKSAKERLLLSTVKRILETEKANMDTLRQKLIVTLASSFNESVRSSVLTYLLTDIRTHLNIALAWLYEEYSIMQGFSRLPVFRHDVRLDKGYSTLLNGLVNVSANDPNILSEILLEAPLITDQVLDQLCVLCKTEESYEWALTLLHDLIVKRPPKQITYLSALLTHTTHSSELIRTHSMQYVLDLYKRSALKSTIEKFVRLYLDFLRLSTPPASLFGSSQGRISTSVWQDDMAVACFTPYLALLPFNETLIHDLTKVYIQTNPDIKRVILRHLETPIRAMGMDSADLLKFVEECPKGSETLITRVIHILTDKGPPSPQLVQIVRDLYQTRVSDVRFLIPVLNGLTKKEIIAALPKLIKLNPVVVKEVFNRLLGLHGDSPIAPTELLVALHLIDPSKADLKTTMKATSLCLGEKQVFTQEVLAVVLQQLMDQTPLPTLLMRTVIQALTSYPRLSGFVMNILQRLILKQVWKQKVVWEGFVKCCQRTKPQSFAVLLQLPAPQLTEVLTMCAEFREPLKQYLQNFSEGQRTHIPAAVQEVVLGSNVLSPPIEEMPPPVPVPPVSLVSTPIIISNDAVVQQNTSEPLPPGME